MNAILASKLSHDHANEVLDALLAKTRDVRDFAIAKPFGHKLRAFVLSPTQVADRSPIAAS